MNRDKRELLYSIGVMIAIPVIMILNTVIILSQLTNQTFNVELRRKADLANNIIAQTALPLIASKQYDTLQDNLNAYETAQPSLMRSAVIVNQNNQPSIVARSSSAPAELTANAKTQAELVFDRKYSVASLVNTTDRSNNPSQAWTVMTPVIDSNKTVIAVVSTSLLTNDAQEAIDNAFRTSFIIVLISIALVVALLYRHLRLVGYVQLLAKQRELNQTMSDFLSVATHELKAPTTIIKGYLSNVMDGDFGTVEPKIGEQITVALAQTDRLNALVQDLLNVSRIEQGRIQYNITDVDTTNILQLIVDNYRPIAKEKGLELIYQPDTQLPLVSADAGRVQEIFTNLIDNAIKYTASGSVTISQRLEKNTVVTSVRDTGFGMSPSALQRLFQRFYRVQTSQTQGIAGTGLGLWIIKQYIEAMHGSIEVESLEGAGSDFIVRLTTAPKK